MPAEKILNRTSSLCPECLRRIPAWNVRIADDVWLVKECPEHGPFRTIVWRGLPDYEAWGSLPRPARPARQESARSLPDRTKTARSQPAKIPASERTEANACTRQDGFPQNSGTTALSTDMAQTNKSAGKAIATRGCPFSCEKCQEHHNPPCAVLLEVTSRCNLHCPVCFADCGASQGNGKPVTGTAPGTNHCPDPDLKEIGQWYSRLKELGYPVNIQLSGGEPTVRDDLPDIIALGRQHGFAFIQINSNGLRLGNDPGYAKELKAAGLDCVFLQFDGLDDAIYRAIRGLDLLEAKLAAVENCARAGLGLVLVSTVVRGVNLETLGDLLEFALARVPAVRGLHFQPIGWLGRYQAFSALPGQGEQNHHNRKSIPQDGERVTLPEAMRALASQSQGRIRLDWFLPPAGENPHCSFHCNLVLWPDGRLEPWVNDQAAFAKAKALLAREEKPTDGTGHARDFMARQWRVAQKDNRYVSESVADQPEEELATCGHGQSADLDYRHETDLEQRLNRIKSHSLAISGMAFQDAWNLDLNRLKDCHIGILGPNQRIVPFCAYNLTSSTGQTLYRGRGTA